MTSSDNRDQPDGGQVMVGSAQPHMTQAAIEQFHQILEDQNTAQATHRSIIRAQRAAGLVLEGRPLTQILRPRLISGADHARVCSAGSLLAGALQRLAGYALHDGELGNHVRQILALTPVEKALVAMAPPVDNQNQHSRLNELLSRLDGFCTADRLAFVEYNVHPSIGSFTQETLAEIFAGTPAMRTFAEEYRVHAIPVRRQIVELLIHAWTTGGIPGDGPRVAIVECEEKFSREFDMLQAELHRHGVPTVITSPDDLRYEPAQGALYTRDAHGHRHPITVVYRRAPLRDMLARYGPAFTDHPLVRAWSAGACVMVNSFTSCVANRKSALALLTDPHTSGVLSPQETTAARQHLPWTRLVRPGPTTYHEQEIDPPAFARAHRDNLVLKPNLGRRGQGILCGWQTTDHDWQRALARARHDPHVIQERVTIPKVRYPTWSHDTVSIQAYQESTDPYLFASTAYGCICRLSRSGPINLSSGGTWVPVFQIEPRV